MAAKPVRLRSSARDDVNLAVRRYLDDGGPVLASRFVDSLERTIVAIGRRPGMGSLHFSYELGIPELRARRSSPFPHLVFYVERADHVDVWRVLHERRDLGDTLGH